METSTMQFGEVKTFFHEFGHVVHALCSSSEHSRLAWAWGMVPWPGGVEKDFLEVPSMMLERGKSQALFFFLLVSVFLFSSS